MYWQGSRFYPAKWVSSSNSWLRLAVPVVSLVRANRVWLSADNDFLLNRVPLGYGLSRKRPFSISRKMNSSRATSRTRIPSRPDVMSSRSPSSSKAHQPLRSLRISAWPPSSISSERPLSVQPRLQQTLSAQKTLRSSAPLAMR
jgi:hypothetical protein